eukprot:830736-Rhodomonas_salina.2
MARMVFLYTAKPTRQMRLSSRGCAVVCVDFGVAVAACGVPTLRNRLQKYTHMLFTTFIRGVLWERMAAHGVDFGALCRSVWRVWWSGTSTTRASCSGP